MLAPAKARRTLSPPRCFLYLLRFLYLLTSHCLHFPVPYYTPKGEIDDGD
jgi:hypothetical protein